MAQPTALPAEPRSLGGKSALRHLRQEGKIPGMVYGKKMDATPVQLDGKTFEHFLKRHGSGGLVELQVQDAGGPAVIKEVQRHPVSGRVLHLDFQHVSMEDTITAHVPLVLTGDTTDLVANGGIVEQQITELTVHCRADHLPDQIVVDISNLEIGHGITIADLQLPEGVDTPQSPDTVVVAATMSSAGRGLAAEEAAEEAAAAAGAPGAAAPSSE
jgi:large subunit ribosomal protein L25